ncbi:MAG: cofactor-independent phosphoglycerate mutase [Candidatus Omnitrophica bacterium]|nr:cofactor-independent phosphoglycerate mutase [Candidatus Omnitrophota bacterium]MBU1047228.1 cofactor-independent phosphoglycerate mutase [Candidatus Omnitrophota bacterium]MBU1631231.1 cofactor-independent phosphoglycerate mutase [Candidatus Omnitrophota bacterium]MBU1889186.1 cofactor-independent phosphoglycerate mutase [Candidatus Omnitrophota bacterium]
MKYIMLIGDGMADRKIANRGHKTPLQLAKTPNMDKLAKEGECGMVKTLQPELPKGSDVAIMSLLGYDPKKFYTGRGPLEALNLGINLKTKEIAFRCNFVTVLDNKLIDYSGGHISLKEAKILIEILQQKLGNNQFSFYAGLSYRNIMVVRRNLGILLDNLETRPPHDVTGAPLTDILPKGKSSAILRRIMQKSYELLKDHPINIKRQKRKENPANMIWLWGEGEKPDLPSFYKEYGKKGAVISAVDIVKGIGKAIGMESIFVKNATGFLDTNYRGKVNAAIKAIKTKDFVLVHLEAPDEAGHLGNVNLKIKAIELFDKKIVGEILKYVLKSKDEYKIFVGCDHATPVMLKTHTDEAIPFVIWGDKRNGCVSYDEIAISASSLYFEKGYKLMEYFLK